VRNSTLCLGLAGIFLLTACDTVDDGSSRLHASLDFTPPPGGTGNVLWIAEGGATGSRLLVDLVARDISLEFDGFNVEILFDPLVVEAESITSGGALLGCTTLPVLTADNVANGNANTTGTILIGEAISGSAPPACTIAGTATLARVSFRPRGRGTAALTFVAYNGNPSSPAGSRLFRRNPVIPDVGAQFFDSGALVQVRR
jgi:hypothetical protein